MNTIGEQLPRESQRRRETIRLVAIGVGTGVVVLGLVLAAFHFRPDPSGNHVTADSPDETEFDEIRNAIEETEGLLAKERERIRELETRLKQVSDERDEAKLLLKAQEANQKLAEAKQELAAANRLVEQEQKRFDDKVVQFGKADPSTQAFLKKVGDDVQAGKEISLETAKRLWQTGLGLEIANEKLAKDGALDPADLAFLHSMTDKIEGGESPTVEEAKRIEEVIGPGPVTKAVLKEAARPQAEDEAFRRAWNLLTKEEQDRVRTVLASLKRGELPTGGDQRFVLSGRGAYFLQAEYVDAVAKDLKKRRPEVPGILDYLGLTPNQKYEFHLLYVTDLFRTSALLKIAEKMKAGEKLNSVQFDLARNSVFLKDKLGEIK